MTPREAVDRWLFRLHGPEAAPVVLTQRRVFVLPTGAGLAYGGVLLLMLTGAINYSLSLGHMLTFLLAGVGIVAILHTFNNLAGLRVVPGRVAPVFAGERAAFELLLDNPGERPRRALELRLGAQPPVVIDVPPHGTARAVLEQFAPRRGWLPLGRVTLSTRYPLGLIRAWGYAQPDLRCLVYPAPEAQPPELPAAQAGDGDVAHGSQGQEDFSGLRGHQPSDSPRHVAWKAVARQGQEAALKTKQFSGGASFLRLDLHTLPPSLDVDQRLSRLTAWALTAHRRGIPFGLRLGTREIAPASGEAHLRACLEALALHGRPER